jgi:hypothetical protein
MCTSAVDRTDSQTFSGPDVDQSPTRTAIRTGSGGGRLTASGAVVGLTSVAGVQWRATYMPCKGDNCGHWQSLKDAANALWPGNIVVEADHEVNS